MARRTSCKPHCGDSAGGRDFRRELMNEKNMLNAAADSFGIEVVGGYISFDAP